MKDSLNNNNRIEVFRKNFELLLHFSIHRKMASTMQLEFSQAMSDFKTMFPEMDRDVIEAVLRVNQGAVDATIDQLLAMSTDNQNERLRNELENSSGTNTPRQIVPNMDQTAAINVINTNQENAYGIESRDKLLSTSPRNSLLVNTGASPKLKKILITVLQPTLLKDSIQTRSKWNPPLLGPLPAGFLRLSNMDTGRTDYDLPDEQFALMLQNEEFMNELRWNQEFMTALAKEQQEKGRSEDDAIFTERLKHMGKVSRKKFLQMARVFTWQRNKKPSSVRHPDSLLLKEEHSDDEDLTVKNK